MQGIVDTTGTHKLRIRPISSVDSIQIMQIKIYVNFIPIPTKKIVIMPRKTPYKLIYVQSFTSVTFTKSTGLLKVYSMHSTNRLKQQTLIYSGFSSPKTLYLAPGYYSIQLTISPLNSNTETLYYQSDPYPCPYSPEYNDVDKIFEPCSHGPVGCPPNEMLVNGVCICKIHRIRINGQCVCKPGLSDINGICVCPNGSPPPFNGNCNQCPLGQIMGANGYCVCINTGLPPNAGGTCNCPPGQTPSGFNGVCVCISTGQPPDSMGNCNDCPPGMIMNSFG